MLNLEKIAKISRLYFAQTKITFNSDSYREIGQSLLTAL